jgi:poly-gamma-glutamate synthesis protein (capsule biosynthesis protein)
MHIVLPKEEVMKKNIFFIILCAVVLLSPALSSCNISKQEETLLQNPSISEAPSAAPEITPTPEPTPSQSLITLSFVGDCVLGNINEEDKPSYFPNVYKTQDSYTYPFDLVKDIFKNDDLTISNCEGTFTESTLQGNKKWRFRGPKNYAGIFAASSIEAVSICNNHVPYDYLSKGYEDTKKNLKNAGCGIFYTKSPYITEAEGIQVVVIGDDSTSMGTSGVKERVASEIKKYKKKDNLVIVDMHWGAEYQELPTQWQKEAGRTFINSGADLVVGQHPHILQGIELYKGKYIVYSLGNFAFGGNDQCKHPETFIFRISFNITDGSPKISEACIVPCFMTSTREKDSQGILKNNYQPQPVEGAEAEQVIKLLLKRSSPLKDGIDTINVYDR